MEPDTNDSSNQQFTCEICIEPTSKRFSNADRCSHPFCTDYMISYFRVNLDDNNVGNIKCPALNCDHMLEPSGCAPIIGHKLFVRWMDVLCEETIVRQEKCYCPYRTCNVPILNECGGDPKKSKCPRCKRWFCFHCKGVWHAGFKCEESDQYRDINNVRFGQLAESQNWKRCPGCKHFVERTEGCSNIKCRCGNRFCYVCGESQCCCYKRSLYQEFQQLTLLERAYLLIGLFLMALFLLWVDHLHQLSHDPLRFTLFHFLFGWMIPNKNLNTLGKLLNVSF